MSPPQSLPQDADDDYEVIRISINWGTVSIVAFVIILVVQLFGGRVFELRITQVFVSTLALAVGGLTSGLIGMKVGRAPQASRLGAFLNGVVLFCIFILVPVTFMVLRFLR